jgi:integrase
MGVYRKGEDWYIDYYVNGLRKREKIGQSKKLAMMVLKKRKVEIAEGRYLDIKQDNKIAFSELARKYLELPEVKSKKSYERDKLSVKELLTFFGDRKLNTITPSLIDSYKQQRLKQPSKRRIGQSITPASVNRELACLKYMFNLFIKNRLIENNPVKLVKMCRENNERDRVLDKEEFERLLECSPDYLKDILLVAYYTAMRKSEILKLKWNKVDLKKGFIRLRAEDTKTGEGRAIPINNVLTDVFKRCIRYLHCDFVFTKDGKPVENGSLRADFQKAAEKAGIEDFIFHDLRHTCITNWRRQGHDYFKIMKASGHKTLTVFKRYNTVDEEDLKSLVVQVEGINQVLRDKSSEKIV